MTRVLVVDDEPQILRALRINLRVRAYDVHVAATGAEALEVAGRYPPDLVILDLGLPDLDGLDVCKRIRIWSDVPIVVLSADGSEDRKVEALDRGSDDYMTKPFGMRELNARVQLAVRHRRNAGEDGEQPTCLDVGPLHLDLAHYEATYDRRAIDLAPKELEFLAYLARNAGRVCTRQMILEHVWGQGYGRQLHYLKVYAYRIRRKLGDEKGQFLQSDAAVGYRLVPPAGDDYSGDGGAGASAAAIRASSA